MLKYNGTRMPFEDMNRVPYNPYCKYSYIFYNSPIYRAEPVQQSEILDFGFFNIENVRGYYKIDENGNKIRLVNAEDIARGAGLTRINKKTYAPTSRRANEEYEYESIRWSEINQYAQSRLPYLQQAGIDPMLLQYIQFPLNKESYIPIELAVQIISCADSEQAKLFQAIISIKIAKEIDRLLDEKYSEELKQLRNWKEAAKIFINKDIAYLKDLVDYGASSNELRNAIIQMNWL